jgi:hypothetical protein
MSLSMSISQLLGIGIGVGGVYRNVSRSLSYPIFQTQFNTVTSEPITLIAHSPFPLS